MDILVFNQGCRFCRKDLIIFEQKTQYYVGISESHIFPAWSGHKQMTQVYGADQMVAAIQYVFQADERSKSHCLTQRRSVATEN